MTQSTEYALVSPQGQIIRTFWYEGPAPENLAPNKPRWLPVVDVNVVYGSDTQALVGPIMTVEATRVTRGYNLREKNPEEISEMVKQKLQGIRDQFELRNLLPLELVTELSGAQLFDADITARHRVIGILMIVLVSKMFNIPVFESRAWTPHSSLTPVQVTPRDFVNLLIAVAQREDRLFQRKKQLEANLVGISNDPAQVAAFDVTIGWD